MLPSAVADRVRLFVPPPPLPPACSGVTDPVASGLRRSPNDSTLRGDDLGEDGDFGDEPPFFRRPASGDAEVDMLDVTPANSVDVSDRDVLRDGGTGGSTPPLPGVVPWPPCCRFCRKLL